MGLVLGAKQWLIFGKARLYMQFGILGGDDRQIYLANSIAQDGHSVVIGGLDYVTGTQTLTHLPYRELIKTCTHIILPLPATRDSKMLFAPYSSEGIELNDEFAKSLRGKFVYGGLIDKIICSSDMWDEIKIEDYYKREELIQGNAMLTAEGAAAMAVHELVCSLNHSKCLVTGFGRIGKALCILLRSFGAKVDCAARKSKDLAGIRCIGCDGITYGQISQRYDVIFNTVPAVVLGEAQLSKQNSDTVILELASLPGGVDLKAADKLSIRVVSGQSLPGKISPKTAGEFIKEAIYNIMMEES